MASYVLEGPRWKASAQGTTTVTWATDASVPAAVVSDLRDAFATWSSVANIAFQQVNAGANITFSFGAIDGAGKTLGYASYTYSGDSFVSARITFDSNEDWHATAAGIVGRTGADFEIVAVHEIGHAIGLGHDPSDATVMNATLSSKVTGLDASDIAGIQVLYGAPAGAASPPAVSALQPFHYTKGSFDADFYLATYGDVAAAAARSGGDTFQFAAQHYHDFGWKEGRDPGAFFDTKAYLATYADVRAAKIDPLQHYDDFGWKEGRDPSGKFDTDAYRAAYADVAAAGADPLQHYLQFGRYEGRSPFADGVIG